MEKSYSSVEMFWGTAGVAAATGSLVTQASGALSGGPTESLEIIHDGAVGTANLFVDVSGGTAAISTAAAVTVFPTMTRSIKIAPTERVVLTGVRASHLSYIRDATGTNADFAFRVITRR